LLWKTDDNTPFVLYCWILLVLLVKSLLQLFLSFYYDDYEMSEWQLWENANANIIKLQVLRKVDESIDGTIVTNEIAKSIKKAIKEEIQKHTEQHQIKK